MTSTQTEWFTRSNSRLLHILLYSPFCYFSVLEYKRQLSTLREEEIPVAVSESECVFSV